MSLFLTKKKRVKYKIKTTNPFLKILDMNSCLVVGWRRYGFQLLLKIVLALLVNLDGFCCKLSGRKFSSILVLLVTFILVKQYNTQLVMVLWFMKIGVTTCRFSRIINTDAVWRWIVLKRLWNFYFWSVSQR